MAISTHEVLVVPIILEPHPNADTLSIVRISGYTVVVKTTDWESRKLGAYIPPDSLVDTSRQEFAFLKREGRIQERITVRKLRDVISMGLLVPAPKGSVEGDNVADILGVEHYEPVIDSDEDVVPSKSVFAPKYDIETIRKYHKLMIVGEEVYITEKVEGCNARFVFNGEELLVGSRKRWKDRNGLSVWCHALKDVPQIEDFCRSHPGTVLYGEVYGQVGGFPYGRMNPSFVAFDILVKDSSDYIWADSKLFFQLCKTWNIPTVPLLYVGPYSFAKAEELAEGPTTINGANHVREGCVVKPAIERRDQSTGRVFFKLVGNGYYAKTSK